LTIKKLQHSFFFFIAPNLNPKFIECTLFIGASFWGEAQPVHSSMLKRVRGIDFESSFT
jgi:hypothetical protein